MATGKIQDMPLGARLVGFYVDAAGDAVVVNGSSYIVADLLSPFTIKPACIEVHDDIVTLLSFYGGSSRGKLRPAAEINIVIGTLVEWEME